MTITLSYPQARKGLAMASPSQSRPVPAIFSAATSGSTMSSKIPILCPSEPCPHFLISIPLILASFRQGSAVIADIVAHRWLHAHLDLLGIGIFNDPHP